MSGCQGRAAERMPQISWLAFGDCKDRMGDVGADLNGSRVVAVLSLRSPEGRLIDDTNVAITLNANG